MNPEFLTEGTAVEDFMKPDRIVLGATDARTLELQREVYATFSDTPILTTNNKTAEMIKYTSNSVLATLISFSNEIANLCSALGDIDVADVMRGVHLARYFSISSRDRGSTKAPITSFLWAGCGYGGSCLPKDTKALSAHGAAHGERTPLLDAVIQTNLEQPERMIRLLRKHFPKLEGLDVSVLGLAFKEDTDDVRESPAISLVRLLKEAGAHVRVYDPLVRSLPPGAIPEGVIHAASLADAIESVRAALLVTCWDEFRQLPELLRRLPSPPLLIDGRRIFERGAIARYDGIGL
jgi:UDPglucose 6-dehydrogenase/GDP-mannose 6-dehydrogenase